MGLLDGALDGLPRNSGGGHSPIDRRGGGKAIDRPAAGGFLGDLTGLVTQGYRGKGFDAPKKRGREPRTVGTVKRGGKVSDIIATRDGRMYDKRTERDITDEVRYYLGGGRRYGRKAWRRAGRKAKANRKPWEDQ